MQGDADAAEYLERAAHLLRMAAKLQETDPKGAEMLMGIAESYQRIADKLMGRNGPVSN